MINAQDGEIYQSGVENMSLSQKLASFFSNRAETRDHHVDVRLKTRYYKTTKDKGLQALENFFKHSQRFEINSMSTEHGEISVNVKKGKKAFIIATVIMVRPFQTAIDFSVMTESLLPIDFGYSTRLILELYEQMNKELPALTDKYA